MNPYVERMKTEQEELVERMGKLDDFMSNNPLFDDMDPIDQRLMQQQLREMIAYLLTLTKRIKRAAENV